MRKIFSTITLVFGVLVLALALGCKAKTGPVAEADPQALQAAQQLPEGTNALAALDQKDYEGAVKGLVQIHQSINGPEQEAAFLTLKQHFKSKLLDAAPTDPKAAESLNTLRFITQGR